jgi:hypothetical protein
MNSPIPQHEYSLTAVTPEGRVKCRLIAIEKRPGGLAICRRKDPFDAGEIEFEISSSRIVEFQPGYEDNTGLEAAWAEAFRGFLYGEDETANAKAWFSHGFKAGKNAR